MTNRGSAIIYAGSKMLRPPRGKWRGHKPACAVISRWVLQCWQDATSLTRSFLSDDPLKNSSSQRQRIFSVRVLDARAVFCRQAGAREAGSNEKEEGKDKIMQARIIIVAVMVCVSLVSDALADASFTPLGDLSGVSFNSSAFSVSDDGSVVVGYGNGSEAFRWTQAGGMVGLGNLFVGFAYSIGIGVSGDGSTAAGLSLSGNGTEAFRWTQAGGMVGLGDLTGGIFYSDADGVSGDGSVVVGLSQSTDGYEAFRWTQAGGMVGLGDLPGGDFYSEGNDVSDDGAMVVGISESTNGTEAFRWTQGGGMVGLGDLTGGDFYSVAFCVSSDGSVVTGRSSSANGDEAFRWTQGGGMVGLGNLFEENFDSYAFGVSGDGSLIVGRSESVVDGSEAFIWDSTNGMRSLRDILIADGVDMTDWTLFSATAISADGTTVVGYGTNPSGNTEAYLVRFSESTLLEGDANRDDVVSADDYSSVQVNFGDTGEAGIPGDANGDTVVSADDYGSVQANFGNTLEMGSDDIFTPEPATMSLLVIGSLALLRRKRLLYQP